MERGESKPIIVLEHVSKSFDGRSIVKEVSLSLHEGELFGLIGPSGSGKTTILRTIMGFYAPDEGRVLFKGVPVKNVDDLTREVGFATQDECFYDDLTCEENMRYFGALYQIPPDVLEDRMTTLLRIVELEKARESLGKHLSGGMRRRLDVAIALLHEPKVVIFDEPTSGLDPVMRKHMLSLIETIKKQNIAIIITSHLLEELEQLCDTVAIIAGGKLVAVGAPSDITDQFIHYTEIHLITYPGNYARILESVRGLGANVLNAVIEPHQMFISTTATEDAVYAIMRSLGPLGEHLIDIDVNKPTLTQVFEKVTEEPSVLGGKNAP